MFQPLRFAYRVICVSVGTFLVIACLMMKFLVVMVCEFANESEALVCLCVYVRLRSRCGWRRQPFGRGRGPILVQPCLCAARS